jgi:hypothetical protein
VPALRSNIDVAVGLLSSNNYLGIPFWRLISPTRPKPNTRTMSRKLLEAIV